MVNISGVKVFMIQYFKKHLLKYLPYLFLLFFVFSFTLRTDLSFNQDLGRHLKLGEIIVNSKEVPKTNLFSYTYPDFPFINHHFLFEVLTYLGNQTIGLNGLLVLKTILILLSVAITLKIAAHQNSFLLLLPIGFIFLHTLRDRVELRPEILSFLFTALTYFILENYEKHKTKLIFLLPLIQIIWVNSHIYFFVGFALQAIFLTSLTYQYLRSHTRCGKLKLAGFILVLSGIISLINPNGLEGLLYPLRVFGNYGYTIAENQTIFLLESLNFKDPDFLFVKLSILIALASIVIGLFRHNMRLKNFLLISMGIFFALSNVRSFPYLIFISLPATLENFDNFKKTYLKTAISIFAGLLLLYESALYLNGEYYKYSDKNVSPKIEAQANAKEALDFVLAKDLPGPIFNNFDIGSYIIYREFPKYQQSLKFSPNESGSNYKVFVDGRPESYPKEFFQSIYIPAQENPENFKKLDGQIGFKTIIFSNTDQTPWGITFLNFITHDPLWKIVYFDNFMIVLVKEDVLNQKNLSEINLDKLSPGQYSYQDHASFLRMSIFLFNTGYKDAARLFAQKSLSIFPESPLGNLILANLTPKTNNIFLPSNVEEYLQKSKNPVWW